MSNILFRILRICIAIYFIIASYGIITLEVIDWKSVINIIINVMIIVYMLFYTKLKKTFIKKVKIIKE